jgi:CMP-N,N'-diacetyllegionaminic acid synthase
MDVISLVTARGGSKGVPRKNLQTVGGQPLIAWTIQAALDSCGVGRVIVSTDDDEITAVSRQFGAEVPFRRPAELAGDASPHVAVVEHAIRWLADIEKRCPEYLLMLQPTSPLRVSADIDGILAFAASKNADAVVSVTEMQTHPHFALRLDNGARLLDLPRSQSYIRRQDLEPRYAANGALYLFRTSVFLKQRTFFPPGVYGYLMPPERSLDVDTVWDLQLADLILRSHHSMT